MLYIRKNKDEYGVVDWSHVPMTLQEAKWKYVMWYVMKPLGKLKLNNDWRLTLGVVSFVFQMLGRFAVDLIPFHLLLPTFFSSPCRRAGRLLRCVTS